jgi:hypothetical protein
MTTQYLEACFPVRPEISQTNKLIFETLITKRLIKLGAEKVGDWWHLQTAAGLVYVRPEARFRYNVFAEFDDPAMAVSMEIEGAYPHTANWSFQMNPEFSPAAAAKRPLRLLTHVANAVPNAPAQIEAWARETGQAIPMRGTPAFGKLYHAWEKHIRPIREKRMQDQLRAIYA